MALLSPNQADGFDDWSVVLDGPCPWELKAACPTEAAARAAMRLLLM